MTNYRPGAKLLGGLLAATLLLFGAARDASAQHEHHGAPTPTPAATPAPTPSQTPPAKPSPTPTPAHGGEHGGDHQGQPHQHDAGAGEKPRDAAKSDTHDAHDAHAGHGEAADNRDSSGTSWQPASTPAYMLHKRAG